MASVFTRLQGQGRYERAVKRLRNSLRLLVLIQSKLGQGCYLTLKNSAHIMKVQTKETRLAKAFLH